MFVITSIQRQNCLISTHTMLKKERWKKFFSIQERNRPGREGSRVAIGRTSGGRYLRVIYVPDPVPESVFVITAFELRSKPLFAYRRRRRRKKNETR